MYRDDRERQVLRFLLRNARYVHLQLAGTPLDATMSFFDVICRRNGMLTKLKSISCTIDRMGYMDELLPPSMLCLVRSVEASWYLSRASSLQDAEKLVRSFDHLPSLSSLSIFDEEPDA
jgi:hypothetical protein